MSVNSSRNGLKPQENTVISVQVGTTFEQLSTDSYCINPQQLADYEALLHSLEAQGHFPTQLVHCWSVTQNEPDDVFERTDLALQQGFYSLLYLIQALGKSDVIRPVEVTVISNQMQAVTDADWLQPEKATLLGAVKTIGMEASHIQCRSLDIALPLDIKALGLELQTPIKESIVAYRQGQRWTQSTKKSNGVPANNFSSTRVPVTLGANTCAEISLSLFAMSAPSGTPAA
ncbi:conserved hypothetical protein [Beggiatoa sp. SS]|nr:conserved hypothetical protein [Beggiatoa sp. SS]